MRILYGLPSEGMGHATRSKVIIEHLMQSHDVYIVTSNQAYTFMQQYFPNNVIQIEGFHLAYTQNRVSIHQTVLQTLRKAPYQIKKNIKQYLQYVHQLKIDCVISDFESFSWMYAKLHRKPLISIDNMQIIDRAHIQIPIPRSVLASFYVAKQIIKAKVPGAQQYLITSFFYPEIRLPHTQYISPIIRPEIVAAKPSWSNHMVVYQRVLSLSQLLPILQAIPDQLFYVYGISEHGTYANVVCKPFSNEGFIADLVSAKGIITQGGFSLLSEAVYLQKPVLSMPIPKQFEQWYNAQNIQSLGYGMATTILDLNTIQKFIAAIPQLQKNLAGYSQHGNQQALATIDRVIRQCMVQQ